MTNHDPTNPQQEPNPLEFNFPDRSVDETIDRVAEDATVEDEGGPDFERYARLDRMSDELHLLVNHDPEHAKAVAGGLLDHEDFHVRSVAVRGLLIPILSNDVYAGTGILERVLRDENESVYEIVPELITDALMEGVINKEHAATIIMELCGQVSKNAHKARRLEMENDKLTRKNHKLGKVAAKGSKFSVTIGNDPTTVITGKSS